MNADASLRWIGRRIFLWPSIGLLNQFEAAAKHAIVASRRSSMDWQQADLWRTLRQLLDVIHSGHGWLLTADGCTMDRVLASLPADVSVPVVRFVVRGLKPLYDAASCQRWVLSANRIPISSSQDQTVTTVIVSPELRMSPECLTEFLTGLVAGQPEWLCGSAVPQCPSADQLSQFPLSDRLCFAGAETLHVLNQSPSGNIAALSHCRLNDPDLPQSIFVPWEAACVSAGSDSPRSTIPQTSATNSCSTVAASSDDEVLSAPQDWLCHWTRECPGRWPDESETQWVARMFEDSMSSDGKAMNGPLKTLVRIVGQMKLIASPLANRGRHSVVCFTEVPLTEFRTRRIYRRHRRRFDFESYGVAIRKDVLSGIGARPVIYGTDDVWFVLPSADRPYFQLTPSIQDLNIGLRSDGSSNRPRSINQTTDFSAEREWRIPHDIDLTQFDPSDVRIFVNTPAEKSLIPNCPSGS